MRWTNVTVAQLLPQSKRTRATEDGNPQETRLDNLPSTPSPISWRLMDWLRYPACLALINLCVTVSSLLVITWFAAAIAGYRALQGLRDHNGEKIVPTFVECFKRDLPRRLQIGAALLVVFSIIATNLSFLHRQDTPAALPLYTFNLFLTVIGISFMGALIRASARHGRLSRCHLIAAAAQALTPSIPNGVFLGAVATVVGLSLMFPLPGLIFGAPLILLALTIYDRFPGQQKCTERIRHDG